MVNAREPSGRAGTFTTPTRLQSNTDFPFPPRQSLDVSEEVSDFATILARGLRTPTNAIKNWLGALPDPDELGPNEHFAVGEYDDEYGNRQSAMFVCETVGERRQDDYPDWTHPRTPPMPPTTPTAAFNPFEFLDRSPTRAQPARDNTDHQTSFKLIALNSVATGKIVLKRFAKTTGKVLEQLAVMPDYSTPGAPKLRRSDPTISRPLQQPTGKDTPFSIITLEEAQARDQARKANYNKRRAVIIPQQPLERRQVGTASQETQWEDFQNYHSPPNSQEEEEEEVSSHSPVLSLPRIPEHINHPTRKPLPSRTLAVELDKSLPDSPSTDSLRRRTQLPLGVEIREWQPDLLAVPVLRGVVRKNTHRHAVVSQCAVVFESTEPSSPELEEENQEEKVSWPGTPASFEGGEEKRRKPMWWQFESSSSEEEASVDPTQAVWKRMEEELRSGGGIRRTTSGSGRRSGRF